MKSLPLLFSLALLLGGCASIPPEALTHATALKNYHKKSSVATLGVLDSSTATIKYTLENWKEYDARGAKEYIEACQEASEVFAASKTKLQEITDLTALLPGLDATKHAEVTGKITTKIKELQTELDTRKTSFDGVTKAMEERTAKRATSFNNHVRDIDLTAGKLRALVAASSETVTDGLATEERLLESYLAAQSKMKAVFGPSLAAKADSVSKEAGDLAGKYSPLISTIESVLNK